MLRKTDFYINGRWVAPVAVNDCEVINPATEQAFAVISLGSAADVDSAVLAARRAFGGCLGHCAPGWSESTAQATQSVRHLAVTSNPESEERAANSALRTSWR